MYTYSEGINVPTPEPAGLVVLAMAIVVVVNRRGLDLACIVSSPERTGRPLRREREARGRGAGGRRGLLGAITLNRIRPKAAGTNASAEFDMVTTPTPLQQRALDLLGVKPL